MTHVSASALIKAEKASAIASAGKLVADVADNQELLVRALGRDVDQHDALIIETYFEAVKAGAPRDRFAFVTHNRHDFGAVGGDDRLPHADIDVLH